MQSKSTTARSAAGH